MGRRRLLWVSHSHSFNILMSVINGDCVNNLSMKAYLHEFLSSARENCVISSII